MRISGGNLDRRCQLQVGEVIVSVLTVFALGRLLRGLRVCGFSDQRCCWLIGEGFADLFCIAKKDSAC